MNIITGKQFRRKTAKAALVQSMPAPFLFLAEMWAGGGEAQEKMYGTELPNIRNLRIDGKYREISESRGKISYQLSDGPTITVNDGVCIYTDPQSEPDYQVVAIYPYRFLTLEVKKL